ncbi:MAG: malonyl-CoA decarboxylase [Pseudomonadota bacterium]
MSLFADILSSVFELRYRSASEPDQAGRSMEELMRDLLGSSGEVSGMTLARHILDRYQAMSRDERKAFFELLVHGLEIDPEEVRTTLAAYEATPGKATYHAFVTACEPDRQELARRLNQVPGATAQLVAMRKDLLGMLRANPGLAPLDLDLTHLFASWFNRGFLVLRPINWETPANILEKIIAYEAVHAIDSWSALRRRLEPTDRRCFAFFHPAMSDEPLIFVQVALTSGVPNSVQTLLADDREPIPADQADTAVFYSISNCQSGLAGISFGNSLIKQVAFDLSRELPGLKTFVTLSPIPRLTKWMAENDLTFADDMLPGATAYYLLEAKRPDGTPYDPVARFHLGNGAMVHQIHADADTSPNGIAQSRGMMVNYLYDLSMIPQNHERFAASKEVIASSALRSACAKIAPMIAGELDHA